MHFNLFIPASQSLQNTQLLKIKMYRLYFNIGSSTRIFFKDQIVYLFLFHSPVMIYIIRSQRSIFFLSLEPSIMIIALQITINFLIPCVGIKEATLLFVLILNMFFNSLVLHQGQSFLEESPYVYPHHSKTWLNCTLLHPKVLQSMSFESWTFGELSSFPSNLLHLLESLIPASNQ